MRFLVQATTVEPTSAGDRIRTVPAFYLEAHDAQGARMMARSVLADASARIIVHPVLAAS